MKNDKKTKCLPNNSFEYGGYHFVPERKMTDIEKNSDLCTFMRSVKTDVSLGFFKTDSVPGMKQKYPYSYEEFYEASGDSEADFFKCVENGQLYIPGENELFLFKQ